jgi:hypothetical protein
MEELVNRVKVSSDAATLSKDMALQSILATVYQQICLVLVDSNGEEQTGRLKLRAAVYGFGEPYFADFPHEEKQAM